MTSVEGGALIIIFFFFFFFLDLTVQAALASSWKMWRQNLQRTQLARRVEGSQHLCSQHLCSQHRCSQHRCRSPGLMRAHAKLNAGLARAPTGLCMASGAADNSSWTLDIHTDDKKINRNTVTSNYRRIHITSNQLSTVLHIHFAQHRVTLESEHPVLPVVNRDSPDQSSGRALCHTRLRLPDQLSCQLPNCKLFRSTSASHVDTTLLASRVVST